MTQTCNKYGVDMNDKTVLSYYDNLISDCFRLLGIFEGRDPITKDIVYDKYEAYGHYMRYLDNFCIEIWGAYKIFGNDRNFIKLANTLEGMKRIQINEHHKLRPLVFNCISLCKKIKEVASCESKIL